MRKKIAIAAGGDSGEYEVSMNSANIVSSHLNKSLYDPYIIHMKAAHWSWKNKDHEFLVDKNDFTLNVGGEKIRFDCVFIAIHGTPGEDGKLQGYLEMLGIPYTTCDWITSALTFDKTLCKTVVAARDISVPKSALLNNIENYNEEFLISEIGIPCFVKPNKGGSSVATTWVRHEKDLKSAVELVFTEDDQALIETYIKGTEITCGVLRYKKELLVFPVTEIVSKTEFFDYEAKYTTGMADEITPARIDVETEIKCKQLSAMLYNDLNCEGLARFDYIFNEDAMYFLEVNTVPGLSANSIVPQQAENMGLSKQELFGMMVEDAIYRNQRKKATR